MIKQLFYRFKKAMYLIVGLRDYQTYVAHCNENHPHKKIMTEQEFINERQQARFNNKPNRCC